MTWFPWFLTACVLLAAFGRPQDRPAWTVLVAHGCVNVLLCLTIDQADALWKLPVFASLELLTVYGLRVFAWNRMGVLQSFACLSTWLAHTLLVFDLVTGSSLIYDQYETVILGIAAYQMILGSDGFLFMLHSVRTGCSSRHVPLPSGGGVRMLKHLRSKILP